MFKITVNQQKQESKSTKLPKKFNLKKAVIIVFLSLVAVIVIAGILFLATTWNSHLENVAGTPVPGEVQPTACTDILNPDCWSDALRPSLLKENNKTNVLVVGIDTRASGIGSGIANTDTLLLVTIDYTTKLTRMLSFPRDLYAPYGCPGAKNLPYKIKINAIYAYGEFYCKEKDGMTGIKQTIEKITGEKIQYTILIRLEGVEKGIDAIGGLDVDVPEDYTDVYPVAELSADRQKNCNHAKTAPGYKYCIFTIKKGLTHMSGEEALIYARMREWHTDFYRARHQQIVLEALKNKILADQTPTLEKAKNLLSLYIQISQYLKADIDLNTILGSLALIGQIDMNPMKVVLDPNFAGGGLISATTGGNYAFKDYTFKQVQDKLKFISENSVIYRDFFEDKDARIYAANFTGSKLSADNPISDLTSGRYWWFKNGVQIKSESKTAQTNSYNAVIVDYSNGKKKLTIDWLTEKFKTMGWETQVLTVPVPAADISGTPVTTKSEPVPTITVNPAAVNYPRTKFNESIGVYMYNVPAATAAPTP